MISTREIKILHLETTDVCQAACPLCLRETDKSFDRTIQNHLTVDLLETVTSGIDMANLEKTFACGNYGDPAAGKYTKDIFRWIRSINSRITLGMNTNGALQDRGWWRDLGTILNQPGDYVVFSIDGLEDTNHIYRINVQWSKLMDNAREFIDAGGCAQWDMLVYQHNQHQIDDAADLARRLGFQWFRAKISKRPLTGYLEYPVNWTPPAKNLGPIDCRALREKSLYINAQGHVMPCCWLANSFVPRYIDFDMIQKSWTTATPESICQKTCSTNQYTTTFDQQWRMEIQLR